MFLQFSTTHSKSKRDSKRTSVRLLFPHLQCCDCLPSEWNNGREDLFGVCKCLIWLKLRWVEQEREKKEMIMEETRLLRKPLGTLISVRTLCSKSRYVCKLSCLDECVGIKNCRLLASDGGRDCQFFSKLFSNLSNKNEMNWIVRKVGRRTCWPDRVLTGLSIRILSILSFDWRVKAVPKKTKKNLFRIFECDQQLTQSNRPLNHAQTHA